MLFSSLSFIFIFLPLFLFCYYMLAKINYKYSKILQIIASFVFYCYTNYKLSIYLIATIFVNCIIAYLVSKRKSKSLLLIGVIFNVCLLLFFKYCNFFITSYNSLFDTQIQTLNILVPLGISFITFKYISGLVEIYKNDKYKFILLNYICYISFFPQIISGPISQYWVMNEAFENEKVYSFDISNFSNGVVLFFCGLIKKVLVAGSLVAIESACLVERTMDNSTLALMGILAYSLEIYFDFSGYSDMSNGICQMINVPITKNFDSPYLSTSISDFWKRWHISLTSFLTKYVYIPLGGNRKGEFRTYINIFIVFLVSGIWHGAAWTFILWGVLHGIMMIIERFLSNKITKIRLPKFIGRIYSFIMVSVLWLIFKCDNLLEVKRYLLEVKAMNFSLFPVEFESIFMTKTSNYFLGLFGFDSIAKYLPYFWVIIALVLCQLPLNSDKIVSSGVYTKKVWYSITLAFLAFLSIISMSSASSFIYWSF